MTQESWFQRLWRLITPELIYLAICYIVDLAAAAYLRFSMGGEYSSGNFEKFTVSLFIVGLRCFHILYIENNRFSVLFSSGCRGHCAPTDH